MLITRSELGYTVSYQDHIIMATKLSDAIQELLSNPEVDCLWFKGSSPKAS